ncbi:alpha/beta hydrolase [Cytobacillus sp. NCCP-133]|nr:alpha/beta hydrolase [Cytobacillus sp. NCCP-133]
MNAKQVNVNGTPISFYEEGQGDPVVLIHGFCGSKDYWQKVIRPLAEDYRIIAIDLPGHGDSEMPSGDSSIEKMAELIQGTIQELGVEKASLFGHSLGGYVTLAFAEAHEDKIRKFALIHSTANPDSEEGKKGRDVAAGKIGAEGIRSFVDGLVPNLFAPGEEHKQELQTAKEIGYSTSSEGAKAALKAMKQRPDRNMILKKTELPVLILAGGKDQIIPPEKAFTVERPNIHQETIEEAGHMSMYETPVELVAVIREFMQK